MAFQIRFVFYTDAPEDFVGLILCSIFEMFWEIINTLLRRIHSLAIQCMGNFCDKVGGQMSQEKIEARGAKMGTGDTHLFQANCYDVCRF